MIVFSSIMLDDFVLPTLSNTYCFIKYNAHIHSHNLERVGLSAF